MNKKIQNCLYIVLFCIGLIPYIYAIIVSIPLIKDGFRLFDFPPIYGISAILGSVFIHIIFYFPIYIIASILILVSVLKIGIKKVNKDV